MTLSKTNQVSKNTNYLPRHEALANLARAQRDFVYFVEEIIGASPYEYQKDILRAINNADDPFARIAWHTAHGVGKSTTVSWIVIAFLFTRTESRVVTTASVNRQVRNILWPEIHHWMGKAKKNLYKIGWRWPYNLLDQSLEINDHWFAIGASSDQPANMEGQHADHMLYIVDEAKTVEKGIFEAIEGALTSKVEAKLMVVSTPPLAREGHFYDICSHKFPGWKVFHTSALESDNVSQEWVKQKQEEWGEESPVYISKVMGQFPDSSENTLFPMSWIEKSQERWRNMTQPQVPATLGVDVARYGDDETIIATALDNYILPLEIHVKQDTMQTAGQVIRAIERYKANVVSIDTIGIGSGVYDRVREVIHSQDIPCQTKPVNVAQRAPTMVVRGERLRFKRLRDYMYYTLREMLDPVNCPEDELIALPPDPQLRSQLAAIQYKINSNGEIEVESKDDLKKRGYKSPDRAEAVMMAKAKGFEGWATVIR